jgi:hypothetical protein
MDECQTLVFCVYSKCSKESDGGVIVISGLFRNKAPDLNDSVWLWYIAFVHSVWISVKFNLQSHKFIDLCRILSSDHYRRFYQNSEKYQFLT